jgi:hypothetical protein
VEAEPVAPSPEPTWWQRHVQLITLWALAVMAGFLSGNWVMASIAIFATLIQESRNAVQHNRNDWRAQFWVFHLSVMCSGVAFVCGIAVLVGMVKAGHVSPILVVMLPGLTLLYLVGQVLLSLAWRNSVLDQQKSMVGLNASATLFGLAAMALSVEIQRITGVCG